MSLGDISTRDRNALSPVIQPAVVSPSPVGTSGFISGDFLVLVAPVNLLAPVNTNTLIYIVPPAKRFVVEEVTYTTNSVVGTTKGTLPTVQIFRTTGSGPTNQMSNSFNLNTLTSPNPLASNYWVRTGNASSITGRRVAIPGDSIYSRITVAIIPGGANPYTTLSASCIVTGYQLDLP